MILTFFQFQASDLIMNGCSSMIRRCTLKKNGTIRHTITMIVTDFIIGQKP